MNYILSPIPKKVAKTVIIQNHYTHKWSSCRYALGLFDMDKKSSTLFNEGELIGVAIYGFPVGRQVVKSISKDLTNNQVLELTRFWVKDGTPKNTESFFLGKTFKWLKNNTDIDVLISYSDPMEGHLGIIYQATNWMYQGNNTMLVKGWMHYIQGEWLHPRSVVAKYGTTKESDLYKIDQNYAKKEMLKKHRYIYILNKTVRKVILNNLKHPILPYPKNNNNCDWK